MHRTRLVSLCVVFLLLLCSSGLQSQQGIVPQRIVAPVDESALTMLRGGVPGRARAEFDRGRASENAQISFARLVLARSPQQEAALETFMRGQLDPSSPNYHKWLTPQEFGKLYGPAEADIDTLVTWLQGQGLTVLPVAPGHTSIAFSGSVAQIETAFHTEIHSFNANGEEFLANVTNPSIPAALAPVVSGVAQLDTIHPKPHHVNGGMGRYDSQLKRLTRADVETATPAPMLTTAGSSSPYLLFLTPADAATIYDTPNSFNGGFSSGTSYTGVGVTIGIGGEATILPATVANYRSQFVGDTTQPTVTSIAAAPPSEPSTSDAGGEAYLDLEISGGMAPGATIDFYTSSNLSLAIEQAITDDKVDIFSLSFGECEAGLTAASNQLLNQWWQEFAAQGTAVTISAGDNGSAGCDDFNNNQTATYGLQVSGYASTPYNIAVGGTDFDVLAANFSSYASTATGSTGNSGNFYRSALSYIPESPWNDSTTINTTIDSNAPLYNNGKTNIVAGSGGKSSCSSNNSSSTLNGCSGGYTKPSWQRGAGVPNDGVRDLPDVSLMAGNAVYDAIWLTCNDNTGILSGTNQTVTDNCADTTINGQSTFVFSGVGGTSAASPAFAGILALVQQKAGGRIGMAAAQSLYDLYNGPHAAAIFHDVTVGNNSVPCTPGTPNCSKNAAGNYFLTGYDTGTGYDLASGLGSVDATQLVNYWGTAATAATATLTVTPAATSITTGQSLSVAVSVSGSTGTPTGTVALISGSYSSSVQTLSGGAYTFNIPAGSLPVGTDTLTVSYTGDSSYGSATGTATVSVAALTPTVTVTPSSTSILSNASLTVTATITGSGATPTGTIALSGGGYATSAKTLSSGSYAFTIPAGSLSVGTDTLTVSYSGDSSYLAATGSTSVSVTQPPLLTPTVTVTPASSSIVTGQSLSVPVTVTGSGATPTGKVTLSGGGYTSSAQTLAAGAYTFTIPANSLTAGTDSLSVAYSGDSNYNPATGSASVMVAASAYTVAPPSTAPSVTAGGTTTATVTVSTVNNYSGTVSLACILANSPTGAVHVPTCSITGSPVTLSSSATSGTATVNFSTTAATSNAVDGHLAKSGSNSVPVKAGAAALLALLTFFGIPARRRVWRTMLGIFVLVAALGTLSACGSTSTSGGGGGNSIPGTTAGAYQFTITGTGTPAVTPAPETTITLTVN